MPTIDRQKKTITVSKDFMILAGQIDTQEFEILNELQQNHPGYEIKIRTIAHNPNKRDYGELTYKAMRDYIIGYESIETRDATLEEFEAVQKVAKTMGSRRKRRSVSLRIGSCRTMSSTSVSGKAVRPVTLLLIVKREEEAGFRCT